MAADPDLTLERLADEIRAARRRVRRVAPPTPLDRVGHPCGGRFWLKREDLSPIHAFKWRGAFNKVAALREAGPLPPLVAASAGNHAQGVALAACRFRAEATIFMPECASAIKIREVKRLGGRWVRVVLAGTTFDEAAALALGHASQHGSALIPAFDDLCVVAGQGTIGDEIVRSGVRPRTVYIQVGGGGLAAGVAAAFKAADAAVRVVGVEGEGQASMAAATAAGRPVAFVEVDPFCDGTAVRCVGALTYQLCSSLLDDLVTVSKEEVCAAIGFLWEACRIVPEPSGALGLAALLREHDPARVASSLTILSGANIDFSRLAAISGLVSGVRNQAGSSISGHHPA